jgi:hypothetical protein
MAFSSVYLAQAQLTQIFDATHNSNVGIVGNSLPNIFSYNAGALGANDTTAATQAADYFLPFFGSLKQGDFILVYSNNPGYHVLAVTASNSVTVTTVQVV